MGKSLKDMSRQDQAAYFKSKDYCGEQLKVVMDAVSYGINTDYLHLFEDTTIPVETMEIMFTSMKEDYGVKEAAFLSTVHKEESGRILLEALKAGVPLSELQGIYQNGMLPIELREQILPLMQGRRAIPEKIGEQMEFLTETVRELKESLSRQNSFIEDLKKSMEEKVEIFSEQEKETGASTESIDDAYYLELEEQFRQAREDAERLLEEREETNRKIRELEAENKHLHEQQRHKLQEGNQPEKADCQRYSGIAESNKQSKSAPSFSFPFIRKKPGLLEKLAGELDARQIAEVRLGIEDGLTESQLALLADKAMDAEKMRELRMTMKILNERGQGT